MIALLQRAWRQLLKRSLRLMGYDFRFSRAKRRSGMGQCSLFDEEQIISRYIAELDPAHRNAVDIGAKDGLAMSNTFALYERGWQGLAVECHPAEFSELAYMYLPLEQVQLSRCKVKPDNVIALLAGHEVPKEFGFLNLDIDGYDFFVLQRILSQYRPQLVCTEINEKIPPPVRFTVNFAEAHCWTGDHFYGQSLSQLYTLCEQFDYALVELHYANAFLIPRESCPQTGLSPEEAYRTGYLERPDRHQLFPANHDVEQLLHLPPEQAVAFIEQLFAEYQGKFTCLI